MRIPLPERPMKLEDCTPAEVENAFGAIAAQQRYSHHLRMPVRICRSLDAFGLSYEPTCTRLKLTVFYLFAGVVDDWLDERWTERGPLLLARLAEPLPCFDRQVVDSAPLLATEFLKACIAPENYLAVLSGLHELYREVVREYQATDPADYFKARQATGRLTADVSYLLVADELHPAQTRDKVRPFMNEVGAVGNLVDSLVDLPGDQRRGLLGFRSRATDWARLLVECLARGMWLLARHPRLVGLYAAAVHDTWQDATRRSAPILSTEMLVEESVGGYYARRDSNPQPSVPKLDSNYFLKSLSDQHLRR
jgi:hypothetical protein